MTDRTSAPADLEPQLRSLLSDRAATIDGPPPGLPDAAGTSAATTAAIPLRLHAAERHRRPRWIAGAAAAVLVLALGGLVLAEAGRDRDGTPDQVVTTAPPVEGAGLPAAFDLDTAQPVFRVQGAQAPEAVAQRYLGRRLSGTGDDPATIEADLVLDAGTREGAIVPVRWRRSDQAELQGTVLVKIGERGSEVVASTTVGVDLSDIDVDGTVISGRVRTEPGAPDGEPLVDVLPRGQALPRFGRGDRVPTGPVAYGATAEGDEPFTVDTEGSGAVVTVRIGDDPMAAISEVYLDAPDPDAPTIAELEAMSPEELAEELGARDPDPRCTAADEANVGNMVTLFPNGPGTAAPEAAPVDVFDLPPAATPAEAVAQLGSALDVPLELTTIAVTGNPGSVGGANVGDVATDVFMDEVDGGWKVWSVETAAACSNNGVGNLSAPGAANPKTHIGLSAVAGAVGGRAWYRMEDGTTWTLPLDADDFGRGNIAIPGEWTQVKDVAIVGHDADGDVILVNVRQL